MDKYLPECLIDECGLLSVPACSFLVNSRGNLLDGLPLNLNIALLGDEPIWFQMGMATNILLAMALDVALRVHAEAYCEMTIDDIFSQAQDTLWASQTEQRMLETFKSSPDAVTVVLHKSCGLVNVRRPGADWNSRTSHSCMKKGGQQDDYEEITTYQFVDLPYTLTRAFIYKAIVERKPAFKQILMWG